MHTDQTSERLMFSINKCATGNFSCCFGDLQSAAQNANMRGGSDVQRWTHFSMCRVSRGLKEHHFQISISSEFPTLSLPLGPSGHFPRCSLVCVCEKRCRDEGAGRGGQMTREMIQIWNMIWLEFLKLSERVFLFCSVLVLAACTDDFTAQFVWGCLCVLCKNHRSAFKAITARACLTQSAFWTPWRPRAPLVLPGFSEARGRIIAANGVIRPSLLFLSPLLPRKRVCFTHNWDRTAIWDARFSSYARGISTTDLLRGSNQRCVFFTLHPKWHRCFALYVFKCKKRPICMSNMLHNTVCVLSVSECASAWAMD